MARTPIATAHATMGMLAAVAGSHGIAGRALNSGLGSSPVYCAAVLR
jgi:hypothetical protein